MSTRRDFLRMIGLGAGFLAFSPNSGLTDSSIEKPNVVFLLADDLGFKDVGYQGGEIRTPNIDQLATEGTRLDQFYVQPVCSPTRSSLMTGRYPMRYGLQVGVVRPWARHGLPLNERTLAEALREAGYTTAICGKWHLGHLDNRYLPTSRGFDHQYGHYNGALDYFTHIRDKALDWNRDDKPLREKGYTTTLIADESARLIEQHDASKPLFLYVPFNAPHSPFQAPQPYLDMYKQIKTRNGRAFAAMVTCMDDAIGRIVSALDKRDMRRNTVIFFCSDNGGANMVSDNGPLRGQKGTLYEGGIRVAALAVWPGVLEAGAVVKEPLHMVDMYPTILRLAGAGARQPLPLDGKDAWSTIASGQPTPHKEILLNVTPYNGAIRQGDWKLVHNGRLSANYTGDKPTVDTYELFNLADDPHEQNDLSDKFVEELRQLQGRLRSYAQEAAPANVPPNRMPKEFNIPKAWGHPD